jgi:hypothetical protein
MPCGYVLELTRWLSPPGKGERMRWLSELDLRHAPDPGYNVVFVCSLRMCTARRLDLHAQARHCCMTCLSLQVDDSMS